MKDQSIQNDDKMWKDIEKSHRRGKVAGGLLVVAAGSLFLARELGVVIPEWVFTWKMVVMGLGVIMAIKHKFLHPAWIVLVAIGGAFLLNDICPDLHIKPILWPVLIIIVGLFIVFKPRRNSYKARNQWRKCQKLQGGFHPGAQHSFGVEEPTKEDFIDSTAFFAEVKKNILSKNFKGGDITNVFGGSELNLSQADFEGKAELEITQVFGGTKLIVPANWEIRSELVTVFGSVEDKRPVQTQVSNEPMKVLLLKGTTFFGGIDIKSF